MGALAGRAGPAGHGAEPLHPRRLSGAEVPQGPRYSSRNCPVAQGVQARAPERHPSAPGLHARGRHRHHPERSRRVPRARGQLPLSLGRVLRAREPQHPEPSLSGVLQVLPGQADQGLPDPAARHPAARRAALQREAGRRDPHAWHGELRVLRALVPGPRDGRGARRGSRPDRRGQLRLHADDAGQAEGGRDLPPGRRRLHRSAHVPARQPPGRAGAHERLSRGQRGARQRPRRGRRRRQVGLRVHARADPLLSRRGRVAGPGTDLPRRPRVRPRLLPGPRARAGDQDHRRLRRLRHADGAVRGQEGDRDLSRAGQEEPGQLHRSAARRAVGAPDVYRRKVRGPPHRSAAVHPLRRFGPRPAGRPDARGAAAGFVRGQLLPGRRQQGHLGSRREKYLMLSRVADSLYWMGRYLERAENITRLLLVTEDFSTETQGLAEDLAQTAWKDMLEIFPSAQLTREIIPFAPLSVPYLYTFFTDQANAYSINFSIRKARENARSVREALTLEVFLALNEVFRSVEGYERKGMPDLPAFRDALGAIHKGIFTVVGAIEHTSTHDDGWRFLKLGESLERSYRSALVLRTRLPALLAAEARGDAPLYYTQWRMLLRGLSSLENYRRVYGGRLEPNLVIGFLLFDADSPRSLRYGASVVRDYLAAISGPVELTAPARIIGRLHADLRYDDEAQMRRGDFVGFLDRVVGELAKAHDAIATQYFVT